MDAHLYFIPSVRPGIATIELHDIRPHQRGEKGRIYGRWLCNGLLLELTTRPRGEYPLGGRWYYVDPVTAPPRNLDDVRELLARDQAQRLDAGLGCVAEGKGESLVLLVWETEDGPNALTLVQQLVDHTVVVNAVETAPTDSKYLAMRAGPDFETLREKRIVLFGAGAVGSHLAVRLAECGIGTLAVRDTDLLRPGNVVRHVGRRDQVGLLKRDVVKAAILERVP